MKPKSKKLLKATIYSICSVVAISIGSKWVSRYLVELRRSEQAYRDLASLRAAVTEIKRNTPRKLNEDLTLYKIELSDDEYPLKKIKASDGAEYTLLPTLDFYFKIEIDEADSMTENDFDHYIKPQFEAMNLSNIGFREYKDIGLRYYISPKNDSWRRVVVPRQN